jgi:hypothetical protein
VREFNLGVDRGQHRLFSNSGSSWWKVRRRT